jgi:hypothetical protein
LNRKWNSGKALCVVLFTFYSAYLLIRYINTFVVCVILALEFTDAVTTKNAPSFNDVNIFHYGEFLNFSVVRILRFQDVLIHLSLCIKRGS